jgi:predicted esterase/catechol 2,3-dioxygenase-like lactoylglutathione lyase family enzyme
MSEAAKSPGLHHVTAFAKDPQRNLDFYRHVMGLRLVKLTVNFDAPDVYHTYFGDSSGHPGTLITFFPFPHAARGRPGIGEMSETCFEAPPGSLAFWADRLRDHGVEAEADTRFGAERLIFQDPEGLRLAIAATGAEGTEERAGIGPREALQRISGVTLSVDGYERTAALLAAVLGAEERDAQGALFRFQLGDTMVDLECAPGRFAAAMGAGSVHHVAWRAADDAQQQTFREALGARGLNPTPVLDRNYFRSIYFREPGGVIFEIATDAPGFATDEPMEALGSRLVLPEWLESRRERIVAALPPVNLSNGESAPVPRADLGFIHVFEAGASPAAPTLLLLHGTGGGEADLLPLGRALAPGANLISPRGKVLENGMPRFFRRFAEGVFDEADVRLRAGELADFVAKAREAYGLTGPIAAMGFSNGANIAAALLLLHPDVLDGAVLLRAMRPLSDVTAPALSGKRVLVSAGLQDPIVSAEQLTALVTLLEESGAQLEVLRHDAGHGIAPEELPAIEAWFAANGFVAGG